MAAVPAAAAKGPVLSRGLRVLTFNICFDPWKRNERVESVARIVEEEDPDFACLQEVTPDAARTLLGWPALAQRYDASPPPAEGYGCLMLARKALQVEFSEHDLPTEMDRTLVVGTVHGLGGGPLKVCTAHFESLNSRPLRQKQIAIAADAMAATHDAVLCGDFNFCSYRNFNGRGSLENDEMKQTLHDFTDCWPLLRGSERGYTFDSELNGNVEGVERMRYDRVMWRGSQLAPRRIALIGTEPINREDVERAEAARVADPFNTPPPCPRSLHPSDHFGLVCDFEPAQVAVVKEAEAAVEGQEHA